MNVATKPMKLCHISLPRFQRISKIPFSNNRITGSSSYFLRDGVEVLPPKGAENARAVKTRRGCADAIDLAARTVDILSIPSSSCLHVVNNENKLQMLIEHEGQL